MCVHVVYVCATCVHAMCVHAMCVHAMCVRAMCVCAMCVCAMCVLCVCVLCVCVLCVCVLCVCMLCVCMLWVFLQSCPTLCNSMDCNLPDSSVMKFPRLEYWSGLPCPPPGELPNPRIEPVFPATSALQTGSLLLASMVAQLVKNPPAMWGSWVRSLGWKDPLEKGNATHSSILAWRIPWT